MRQVRPIATVVRAPRAFVFRSLTAFGESSPCWDRGLEPELIEADGTTLTVRFHTRALGRTVSTLERVRLRPPERITYENIKGALMDFREEIRLDPIDERSTRLSFCAEVGVTGSIASGLLERAVAAPLFRRSAVELLGHYRVTIEAAAHAAGLVEPDEAPPPARPAVRRPPSPPGGGACIYIVPMAGMPERVPAAAPPAPDLLLLLIR